MPDIGQDWIGAMRAEDYALAWSLSEGVLRARDPAMRDDPALPYHLRWVWDGRPFDRRHVLVRCYHGLGDTLQFARFLPMLAGRVESLTVEAQPPLCQLLAAVTCIDHVVPFDVARPLPASECDLEITELPFALRATPSQARLPYLRSDPADLPKGTVGLCYTTGEWEIERRIPPQLLHPLAAAHPTIALVMGATDLPVLNPQGCTPDLVDTAALVAGVSLVITVDTMIAHLAGALGRPTWLLLKHDPDWRWPATGRFTPWYPSMRLYHQPRPGDWTSVLAAVTRDLDGNLDSPTGG